ncbi:MAG: ABC transporter permease subunit [Anaeromicrobium sp.]|jgi:iron(III) transport system permease protein|nr:ABC transporter permease subunit [Anaeromicrobium sp.]
MFIGFLITPLIILFLKSLQTGDGIGISNYIVAIVDKELVQAILNSIKVSTATAVITTCLAFILAYTINYTNLNKHIKAIIRVGILMPMLLPTITYGFAIIYSLGKQGIIVRFLGKELFQIYGFTGLLIGYVIYTLPMAFILINNSFKYIDKKFVIVSKLMGDKGFTTFKNTVLHPLVGTIGGAFAISFIASFTDYGIPASIGGAYSVVSTQLYQVMLGSIPDFNNGAVIAVFMLIPAVFGVLLLNYLEKFNYHFDKVTDIQLPKNRIEDICFGTISLGMVVGILLIFMIMFIVPFVESYPYNMSPTFENFIRVLTANNLSRVYKNSVIIGMCSALIGTVVAYICAIVNVRTQINKKVKLSIDGISMITNTVPGMVLGIAYLLCFNNSNLKGTFIIIIACNIVHFFTTPYLMAKNSLSKMNPSFETTGELMGDSWVKTVFRVILPNSASTVVDMFSYYFIQSMVTISAVIFLVSARTSLVTSKIKQLQHYAKFSDIFTLSLLIFLTNIVVKVSCDYIQKKYK